MSDADARFDTTRRELLTKAVYVVPGMLTLTAVPAFASAGSSEKRRRPRARIRRRSSTSRRDTRARR